MKTEVREQRSEVRARDSLLECGDSAPLSIRGALPPRRKRRSSGAVQTLARVFALIFLLFAPAGFVQAQSYAIDWQTIDGGGGTSTGGVYSVSGTIGQPDAGEMSGGNFTLQGGFWGIIAAVQVVGAPYLSVLRTSTNTVAVWWPVSGTSWQLQATASLVNTGSTWSPCSYVTNGANCVYIESPPTGNRFYRLTK